MKTTKQTSVTLLSCTANPVETVYSEWIISRSDQKAPPPEWVAAKMRRDGAFADEVRVVFEKVIDQQLPLGQTIDFVFVIEDMPVTLREQLVRHKIGHRFDDRGGQDWIPDLANHSTFWSQTGRVTDSSSFAIDGRYHTPKWLEENGNKSCEELRYGGITPLLEKLKTLIEVHVGMKWLDKELVAELDYAIEEGKRRMAEKTVAEFYHEQFKWIQAAYRKLVKAGMPLEDARNILPIGMTSRMSWKVNLAALMHLLQKRGCWIAQLGIWEPVIRGIVEELAVKVDPYFRRLIDPPCFKNGEWVGCAFKKENEELAADQSKDLPPCSLWVNKTRKAEILEDLGSLRPDWEEIVVGQGRTKRYMERASQYMQLWRRDPATGERLPVESQATPVQTNS